MKKKTKMSVPEGMEFGKPYTMSSTHNELYWDTERNKDPNRISFNEKLDLEIKNISNLLKEKNQAYGNTALNPTNIFSKLDATEAICARIDDKLARITEDTVDDLIGYLLLLKMSI